MPKFISVMLSCKLEDMNVLEMKNQIRALEDKMLSPDFWKNPKDAQEIIKKIQQLKDSLEGVGKYDRGDAVITFLAGAGGLDSEDFARMLFLMYQAFTSDKGWNISIIHKSENDHGGFKNLSIEVSGLGAYGTLKHENGVHRLVRLSPFNANAKRHTSFAMVEVVPILPDLEDDGFSEDDLEVSFAKSSGPGGQNVNKRETAVRVVHAPSGLSVFADGERTQESNKQKAMNILRGKVFAALEIQRKKDAGAMKLSKTTGIEWGSQIRSYVLHPYQMVKDHRTGVEVRDAHKVLEKGELDDFILAMKEKEQE